jgi:hypothetical protein
LPFEARTFGVVFQAINITESELLSVRSKRAGNLRPNFLIIGAAKAGTSSLYELLSSHPQIMMPADKEPGFFIKDAPSKTEEREYAMLFSNDRPARFFGEASTQYTRYPVFPGVVRRMHDAVPNARLIYLIREPRACVLAQF